MTQVHVSTTHEPGLAHHVNQGRAWLDASSEGKNTASLSYAALELRFAIERLAIHYWASLLNRRPDAEEWSSVGSFKRLERKIYELGGHQRQIDGHFRFMRTMLVAMNIEVPLVTPSIVNLSRHWSTCSEYCHIKWPLASTLPELRLEAHAALLEVVTDLEPHASSAGWPLIHDQALLHLRDRFIDGQATEEDVKQHLEATGAWARVEYPDGREPHFVGEAIPPKGAATPPLLAGEA